MVELLRATTASEKIYGLIDSLESAQLTEIEWQGRYSRSGATLFLKKIKAKLETGKHEHELECIPHEFVLICDWTVDGEYAGQIEMNMNEDLARRLIDTVEMAVTLEKVEENKAILNPRPVVVLEPSRI